MFIFFEHIPCATFALEHIELSPHMSVVAKTQRACDMLEVAFKQRIYGAEADSLIAYEASRKEEGRKAYLQAQSAFKGHGLYLSEMLEMESSQLSLEQKNPDKSILLV